MRAVTSAHMTICGWGEHGEHMERGAKVMAILRATSTNGIYALALNRSGQPKHPLYVANDVEPIEI